MKIETELRIEDWDESTTTEHEDGAKVSRAVVTLGESKDGMTMTAGTSLGDLWYAADGTSAYTSLLHVSGTLEGREGTFALIGEGTFDGTTARGSFHVVAGSGTGGLSGISGTAESTSTKDSYPYYPLSLSVELA
jgi:hypothetical protein